MVVEAVRWKSAGVYSEMASGDGKNLGDYVLWQIRVFRVGGAGGR